VAVYGSSCPACTQAKAVLARYQVRYDEQPMSALPRRYGAVRSMPQITIDGELLGGVNQLLKLARAGGLERIARDDPTPWVRVKRRLGRGYDVVLLDVLGDELLSRRAATQAEAARIADEIATAIPNAQQDGASA
jgi:glutaredoxin